MRRSTRRPRAGGRPKPRIERIPIIDQRQWLGLRQRDVTASTVGALLGVHPYASALGLYLLKTGQIEADAEDTPAMRRGGLLEPVAHRILREDHAEWIDTLAPGAYFRDPDARLGATPDLHGVRRQARSRRHPDQDGGAEHFPAGVEG
jgi:YqaJ-like viral recombinase domain